MVDSGVLAAFDPVPWSVAGTVVAAAAFVLDYLIFRRGRRRKKLSYQVEHDQLLRVHDTARDVVTILFDGEPVRNIHFVSTQIVNDGDVPIVDSDFRSSLSLKFDGATVLTSDITAVSPRNLDPVITQTATGVTVEPLLMNPGDRFTVDMLVDSARVRPQVDARVVGVREVTNLGVQGVRSDERSSRRLPTARVGFALFSVALVGLLYYRPVEAALHVRAVRSAARVAMETHVLRLPNGSFVCGQVVRGQLDSAVIVNGAIHIYRRDRIKELSRPC
jgi:hypothetical protein